MTARNYIEWGFVGWFVISILNLDLKLWLTYEIRESSTYEDTASSLGGSSVGKEISVSDGEWEGQANISDVTAVCVDHIDKLSISRVQPSVRVAQAEQRIGRIKTCVSPKFICINFYDSNLEFLRIVGIHIPSYCREFQVIKRTQFGINLWYDMVSSYRWFSGEGRWRWRRLFRPRAIQGWSR